MTKVPTKAITTIAKYNEGLFNTISAERVSFKTNKSISPLVANVKLNTRPQKAHTAVKRELAITRHDPSMKHISWHILSLSGLQP